MTETLVAVVLVALAFMAVAWVKIRAGCGSDCGACERPCKVLEPAGDEQREGENDEMS